MARSVEGRAPEEPIVVLFSRGVLAAGVAALEGLTQRALAGKRRRKGLKRFNPRREMVWARQPNI